MGVRSETIAKRTRIEIGGFLMANSADVLREIKGLIEKLYGKGNFEGDIPEIKKRLEGINGHLENHSKRIVIAETQIKERTASRVSRKALTGYGGVTVAVFTLLYYLGQARGWW